MMKEGDETRLSCVPVVGSREGTSNLSTITCEKLVLSQGNQGTSLVVAFHGYKGIFLFKTPITV